MVGLTKMGQNCSRKLSGREHVNQEFRKTRSKVLPEAGTVARCTPALSAEQIIEHGKAFVIGKDDSTSPEIRNLKLHAFFLTDTNCGMRYDEQSKVKMEKFKCTKYGIEFGIG